jgi:Purple acid Phosphatase, N-terminal domain
MRTTIATIIVAVGLLLATSSAALTAEAEPTLSDISAFDVNPTTVNITWTVSEPATGQVEYGPDTEYGSFTDLEASLDYSTHIQDITGLEPGTEYHYRVLSTTGAGISLTSDDQTFITPPLPTPGPLVSPRPVAGYGPRPDPATPSEAVTVPPQIDASGASDVGQAIQDWVDAQPDGSLLVFPAGSVYSMERGIHLGPGDADMTFFGYGATLQVTGCGASEDESAFSVDGSSNVAILGFTISGTNDMAGTFGAFDAGCGQFSHGVALFGDSQDIEVADVHVSRIHGDAIYVNCDVVNPGAGLYDFHNNLLELTGRQLVTINQGSDIRVADNILRSPALYAVDSEDCGDSAAVLTDVSVDHNYFDTWNWHYSPGGQSGAEDYYACRAVNAEYEDGEIGLFSNYAVTDNYFTGGCAGWGSLTDGLCDPSGATISAAGSIAKTGIEVTSNVMELPPEQRCGFAVSVANASDGSITGNQAPGQAIRCDACRGVETD